MTEKKYQKFKRKAKRRAPRLKKQIDLKLKKLRNLIIQCNPIELLKFSYVIFFMSALGNASEFQHDFSDITDGRLTEYLQNALVSVHFSLPVTLSECRAKIALNQRKTY